MTGGTPISINIFTMHISSNERGKQSLAMVDVRIMITTVFILQNGSLN